MKKVISTVLAVSVFWLFSIINVCAAGNGNYVKSITQIDAATLQTMTIMSYQTANSYMEESYDSVMPNVFKYKIGQKKVSSSAPVLEEIIFQSEKDNSYKEKRNVIYFVYRIDFVDKIDGALSVYIPVWYKNGVVNQDGTIYFDLSDKYNVNATRCESSLGLINNEIITAQANIYNTEVIAAQAPAQ